MRFESQTKPGAREYANDAPIVSRVTKIYRPDRASPHLVQWGRGQDRRTESFKTPEEQEARYAEIAGRLQRNGDDFIFNRQAKIDWSSFMATIGDASWVDVVAGWRENLKRHELVRSRKTVGEAAKEYIAHCQRPPWQKRAAQNNNPKSSVAQSFSSRLISASSFSRGFLETTLPSWLTRYT